MKISLFDRLSKVNYQVLQEFINTGDTKMIPEELKLYIERLDLVRSLYTKYKSKAFIISTLYATYPELTKHTAELIYYDSINFFNLNNTVKKEAWRNFYAEKMENAALICFEKEDFKTYKELLSEAAKMRGIYEPDAPEIPPALRERRPVIISIQPEDVGMERANRTELAKIIDSMDLPDETKDKARTESGINEITLFEDNAEDKENSQG